MNIRKYGGRVTFLVFIGTVASLPFSPAINRYFLIALAIATVCSINLNKLNENLISQKRILVVGTLALLNLVGLLYTENMTEGFAILERSAIMLIMPIIIIMFGPTNKQIMTIKKSFVVVCLLICCYCLAFAFWRIYESGTLINQEKISDRPYYFFINYELTGSAMGISPIYLGLYLNLCIALLLVNIFIERHQIKVNIVLLVFLHFFQAIIFSLSAVLSLVVIWAILLIKIMSNVNTRRKTTFFIIFLLISSMLAIGVYRTKPLHDRIFVSLDYNFENAHMSYWNGITLRLAVWQCAWSAIKSSPIWGNGTGDAKQVLIGQYKEKNFTIAEMLKLNAHNQYFQSYLMHGILGLGTVLTTLFLPIYHAFKEGNWTLILFGVILLLGFMTEAILSVQKGIVFFSIFLPLLYLPESDNK